MSRCYSDYSDREKAELSERAFQSNLKYINMLEFRYSVLDELFYESIKRLKEFKPRIANQLKQEFYKSLEESEQI